MRIYLLLAFSFSAKALVPSMNCERDQAADPFSGCASHQTSSFDFFKESGEDFEEEKSCKTALDDYSKSETMIAALPAAAIAAAMVLGLTACEVQHPSSGKIYRKRTKREKWDRCLDICWTAHLRPICSFEFEETDTSSPLPLQGV